MAMVVVVLIVSHIDGRACARVGREGKGREGKGREGKGWGHSHQMMLCRACHDEQRTVHKHHPRTPASSNESNGCRRGALQDCFIRGENQGHVQKWWKLLGRYTDEMQVRAMCRRDGN